MLTEPDHYFLPNIADITTYLHGAKIFLKLDLLKGFYKIPMNPIDIPKTTASMSFGTYTFNYSSFGLRNAGATFQGIMVDNVLGNLPFCIAYVNDILIFPSTLDEHRCHLHRVLDHLRSASLIVCQDRCVFGTRLWSFLAITSLQRASSPFRKRSSL